MNQEVLFVLNKCRYRVYSLSGLVPVAVRGALLSLSIFPFREVRNISKQIEEEFDKSVKT